MLDFTRPEYRDIHDSLAVGVVPDYRVPSVYISPSQIDTWANCGMLWLMRYGYGFKERPGLSLLRGSSVHAAAEANLTARIGGADWMKPDDAADIAVTDLRRRVVDEDPQVRTDEGESIGGAIDDTAALARLDASTVAPATEPLRVEQPFTLRLSDSLPAIEGYVDAIVNDGGRVAIRERKTTGSAPRRDRYEHTAQVTVYRMAVDAAEDLEPGTVPIQIDALAAVSLKKGIDYRYVPFELGPTTGGDRARASQSIRAMIGAIHEEAFHPASPGYYLCGARYCGFHRDNGGPCPFGRPGKSAE